MPHSHSKQEFCDFVEAMGFRGTCATTLESLYGAGVICHYHQNTVDVIHTVPLLYMNGEPKLGFVSIRQDVMKRIAKNFGEEALPHDWLPARLEQIELGEVEYSQDEILEML